MGADSFVLLIDDEKDFLDTLSFWLESKGYKVRFATSGKEGLKIIEEEKPYLVFLDINMPELDGIEILTRVRKKNKTIPVIMLTAAINREKMEKAQELGISGFFPKNESLEELGKLVEVTVRMRSKQG